MTNALADYRDLPEAIRAHLFALEEYIGDTDGRDTVTEDGVNGGYIDDGTIDASDAVKAFNGIVAALRERLFPPPEGERAGPSLLAAARVIYAAGIEHSWFKGAATYDELGPIEREEFDVIIGEALSAARAPVVTEEMVERAAALVRDYGNGWGDKAETIARAVLALRHDDRT